MNSIITMSWQAKNFYHFNDSALIDATPHNLVAPVNLPYTLCEQKLGTLRELLQ